MSNGPEFRLGEYGARLNALDARTKSIEDTVANISEKVDSVLVALAEKRGERKAAAYIAGLAGTLVSIIVAIVARIVEHGK